MNQTVKKIQYSEAIQEGFEYLLQTYPECYTIGQGLWSPWYVGSSMNDLEKKFGKNRVIDSPVSENSVTGVALGSALTGMRPIVVHPRMDFMIFASDQIVNQAAKWQSMLGGGIKIPLTIRGIINRGGEQGAQHSQAMHAWYAHIPGLRVVMPAYALDARQLLISSALSNDPVIYIDDRWCYEQEQVYVPISESDLRSEKPIVRSEGEDITLVGAGYTTLLAEQAHEILIQDYAISAEVVDLRVINPLHVDPVVTSVEKTGLLLAIDGGWSSCGLAGEVIASVCERGVQLTGAPKRLTIQNAAAPTSKVLEDVYYVTVEKIVRTAVEMCTKGD